MMGKGAGGQAGRFGGPNGVSADSLLVSLQERHEPGVDAPTGNTRSRRNRTNAAIPTTFVHWGLAVWRFGTGASLLESAATAG